MVGMIYSSLRPFSSAQAAISYAAAMAISSVMVRARTSSTPRKMPGKPSELFTWFGKSLRPVATTRTPAFVASHGQISGIGLAQAKRIASWFIALSHSARIVSGPGRERAIHTSVPTSDSAIPPCRPSPLVVRANSARGSSGAKPVRSRVRMPFVSTIITRSGSAPAANSRRRIATLAAPAPIIESVILSNDLPTTFRAFTSPANVTEAVPCWSSCHTGISISARSVSRMRKHLGLAMSSRLIPPKEGWSNLTVWIRRSGSLVPRQSGTASTPPRYLKISAFPSMTGMPASGPMSPNPSTRVPSETTAIVLPRFVCCHDFSGFASISRQGAATPGVYQIEKSLTSRTGTLGAICTLPW